MALRKFLQTFFDKHEVAWEIFMMVLAVIFVAIGFLPDFISFSENILNALNILDWSITGLFTLEFITRITIADSKKDYLKDHWLDLIALAPGVRWFRLARMARIFRLLRLARVVRGLNTLDQWESVLAQFGRINGLQWILLAFIIVMLITSGLFYFFEHPVNSQIQTYWDALYASFETWATPGYGDIMPVTENGRICGIVLITSGLITWGIIIANLASFLTTRRIGDKTVDPALHEIQHKLGRLDELSERELIVLRGSVNSIIDHTAKKQAELLDAATSDNKGRGQQEDELT